MVSTRSQSSINSFRERGFEQDMGAHLTSTINFNGESLVKVNVNIKLPEGYTTQRRKHCLWIKTHKHKGKKVPRPSQQIRNFLELPCKALKHKYNTNLELIADFISASCNVTFTKK